MLYADVRLPPTLSVPSLIKPFEFPSSVIMPVTSRFPAIFIVPVSSFTRPLTSALLPAIRVPLFVKSFALTSPSTLRTPEVVIFSVVIRLPVTFTFASSPTLKFPVLIISFAEAVPITSKSPVLFIVFSTVRFPLISISPWFVTFLAFTSPVISNILFSLLTISFAFNIPVM